MKRCITPVGLAKHDKRTHIRTKGNRKTIDLWKMPGLQNQNPIYRIFYPLAWVGLNLFALRARMARWQLDKFSFIPVCPKK